MGLVSSTVFLAMFFEPTPANAGENMFALTMDFNKQNVIGVSLSLFGTAELDTLSSDQLEELRTALKELQEQDPEQKEQGEYFAYETFDDKPE